MVNPFSRLENVHLRLIGVGKLQPFFLRIVSQFTVLRVLSIQKKLSVSRFLALQNGDLWSRIAAAFNFRAFFNNPNRAFPKKS